MTCHRYMLNLTNTFGFVLRVYTVIDGRLCHIECEKNKNTAQDAVEYRDFLFLLCYSVFSDLRQYTRKQKGNFFYTSKD